MIYRPVFVYLGLYNSGMSGKQLLAVKLTY